jgi:hypothetical protein
VLKEYLDYTFKNRTLYADLENAGCKFKKPA